MISKEIMDAYETTIGIECHVQLATASKLFASDDNEAKDAKPNSLISPITYGLPGVLPILNKEAVTLAVRAGHALNAEVALTSSFDRKHYFYPDLPKGYQITQLASPIVGKGVILVPFDGGEFKVGITRAHLEEDAGKLSHLPGSDSSLVDLNRAGTPLLEVVSDPDIKSPAQARAFAQELYLLMKYSKVSNADLYMGNMRFDVNVSVAKKGSKTLGVRAEIKNLNSFRSVEKAAAYEFKRQVERLEKGESVVQETRGWDDAKMRTFSQRSKEDSHDYRYFPDPDLPPIVLTNEFVEQQSELLPTLPSQLREKMQSSGLQPAQIESLLQRNGENGHDYIACLIDCLEQESPEVFKFAASYIVNDFFSLQDGRVDNGVESAYLPTAKQFAGTSNLYRDKKISSNGAIELLSKQLSNASQVVAKVADESGLMQTSDVAEIEKIVDEVIAANADAANDVRAGEMKAVGFLVGQVMKVSKGQLNPQTVKEIITSKLS